MNITKREWELAMESEKNREMAMRILQGAQKEVAPSANAKPLGSSSEAIVKQWGIEKGEAAAAAAVQNAECRMKNEESGTSNERNAECRMQNAELVTNIERNVEFGMQNEESGTENTGTAVRRGGRVSRLHTAEEASVLRDECRVLNAEAAEAAVPNAEFRGQSAELRTESAELAITEFDGLKVFNVPKREGTVKQLGSNGEAIVKPLEPNDRKVKREPDLAFWSETSEFCPSPPFPSPQDETDGPQFSMVAQSAPLPNCSPAATGAPIASPLIHGAQSAPLTNCIAASWPAPRLKKSAGLIPLDALPSLMLAETVNVADCKQVPYDTVGAMLLAAASAATLGRVSARMNADYREPSQMFIAIGANPSERKSAAMEMVFKPLYEYEKEESARRAPAVRHYKESRELLEEGIARAKKSGDRLKMSDLIDEVNSMQEVKDYELLLTDATPEALSRAMSRNGGRMALVSSEGAFLNILAGGYSSGGAANVDVVLKGYSGEPVRVERIGRGSEKIEKANLSLCLAVQPDLLANFLSDPTLAGRGMASRFLCCLPESRVGSRSFEGIPANPIVSERYAHRIQEIFALPEGTELPLSPEARTVCAAWFDEIEEHLKPGGELADLGQGWGGKLSGNTIRIAIALTMYTDDRTTISGKTMEGAVKLARWFQAHAINLMGGDSELSPEANEALQYLIRRGESPVSETTVKHSLCRRNSFPRAENAKNALWELADTGYIRFFEADTNANTGRPGGSMLMLHPSLLKQPRADAENEA